MGKYDNWLINGVHPKWIVSVDKKLPKITLHCASQPGPEFEDAQDEIELFEQIACNTINNKPLINGGTDLQTSIDGKVVTITDGIHTWDGAIEYTVPTIDDTSETLVKWDMVIYVQLESASSKLPYSIYRPDFRLYGNIEYEPWTDNIYLITSGYGRPVTGKGVETDTFDPIIFNWDGRGKIYIASSWMGVAKDNLIDIDDEIIVSNGTETIRQAYNTNIYAPGKALNITSLLVEGDNEITVSIHDIYGAKIGCGPLYILRDTLPFNKGGTVQNVPYDVSQDNSSDLVWDNLETIQETDENLASVYNNNMGQSMESCKIIAKDFGFDIPTGMLITRLQANIMVANNITENISSATLRQRTKIKYPTEAHFPTDPGRLIPWEDLTNILVNDETNLAHATNISTTDPLKTTEISVDDFGFDIPADAIVKRLKVKLGYANNSEVIDTSLAARLRTQNKFPTVFEQENTGIQWENLENIGADDDVLATTLSNTGRPAFTSNITMKDFGFDIPEDAVVTGVKAKLKYANNSNTLGYTRTRQVTNTTQILGNFEDGYSDPDPLITTQRNNVNAGGDLWKGNQTWDGISNSEYAGVGNVVLMQHGPGNGKSALYVAHVNYIPQIPEGSTIDRVRIQVKCGSQNANPVSPNGDLVIWRGDINNPSSNSGINLGRHQRAKDNLETITVDTNTLSSHFTSLLLNADNLRADNLYIGFSDIVGANQYSWLEYIKVIVDFTIPDITKNNVVNVNGLETLSDAIIQSAQNNLKVKEWNLTRFSNKPSVYNNPEFFVAYHATVGVDDFAYMDSLDVTITYELTVENNVHIIGVNGQKIVRNYIKSESDRLQELLLDSNDGSINLVSTDPATYNDPTFNISYQTTLSTLKEAWVDYIEVEILYELAMSGNQIINVNGQEIFWNFKKGTNPNNMELLKLDTLDGGIPTFSDDPAVYNDPEFYVSYKNSVGSFNTIWIKYIEFIITYKVGTLAPITRTDPNAEGYEFGFMQITETRLVKEVQVVGNACNLPATLTLNGIKQSMHYSHDHNGGDIGLDGQESLSYTLNPPVTVLEFVSEKHLPPYDGEDLAENNKGIRLSQIKVIYK
ncbi:hypothetical protein [Methanobacterium spitsbergense]|uniref:Uncharacterized protein n=1 Tax=Methanobacterium spitsbergense TaxID=2874285 RepID=A0A8T5UYK8_9EURY|nr:hypothetical protein [Methanobacterium spitsbergense]MBZ2167016.1 hypothetical protein [Methanobacterium spitsbergense]